MSDSVLAPVVAITSAPAARRHRRGQLITASVAAAINDFEAQLGGRPALIAALAVTDISDEVDRVLQHLGDPRHDSQSLAEVCLECRIEPAAVVTAYKSAMINRAQILALREASAATPALVQDLVSRSTPHEVRCTECRGTGEILRITTDKETGEPKEKALRCPSCVGMKTVYRPSDAGAQDRLLDLIGLSAKAGGPSIAITNQTLINNGKGAAGGFAGGGSLEKIQEAVAAITARTKISSAAGSGTSAATTEAAKKLASDSASIVVDGTVVTPDTP